MNEQPTDAMLIAESIAQPDRFGLVFDRHYSAIRAFAWRRLGPAHADDLAAEVFARAFSARTKYDADEADAAPWLFGIASNLIRMHARTESRRLRALARNTGVPEGDFAGAADSRVDADRASAELLDLVAKLKRRDREILLLHAWAGLSAAEIGRALGVPDATIRTRLARLRKKLVAALDGVDPVGASSLEAQVETVEGGRR